MPAHVSHRISLVLALLLIATAVPFAAPAVAVAQVAATGITTGNLRSVTFTSPTTGFVAADNGAILKTTNGGTAWAPVRSADSYSFRGIDFWNATKGVAVDYSGKVAETNDGGTTWTNVNFLPYLNMRADSLVDVGVFNDVAAQWGGMYGITGAGDANPVDAIPTGATGMITTGNFRLWTPITPKPHQSYDAQSQTYYDEAEGEFLDIEYVGSTNTVWGSGTDYWPLDGYNAEKFPLFKSTNGGINWTEISFGTTDLRLEGVAFDAAGTAGIAVGQVVGGTRCVYYTTDGGTTWSPATVSGTASLNAVDMSSVTQGWAVGADGSIIRTTNGGATWTDCTIAGGNTSPLHDIEFRPGTTTGWAVGDAGTVLLTTDGINWSAQGSPPVNTAPVAVVDSYSTPKNVQLVVSAPGVLANDTDAESNPLTAIKVANPAHGSVTLNANGSFTYTPTTGYTGTDSFTYKANDNAADSNTVTVTITISNTAPVAVGNTYTTPKDTQLSVPALGVLANDSDGNGDPLTAIKVANPAHGSVTLNANGSFTYTPTTGYTGPDSFTYKANDGTADSNTVTVGITVGATTPPPPVTLMPVYRFYNFTNGTHFYTDSATERAMVNAKWSNVFTDEGVVYNTNPANNTQPLYRFYNKNSGSHFYTASASEADMILAKWPTIFSLDGRTYAVNPAPVPNSIPVFRFYNLKNGSHFYTASAEEADMVRARWPNVYSYEGPAFWLGQ